MPLKLRHLTMNGLGQTRLQSMLSPRTELDILPGCKLGHTLHRQHKKLGHQSSPFSISVRVRRVTLVKGSQTSMMESLTHPRRDRRYLNRELPCQTNPLHLHRRLLHRHFRYMQGRSHNRFYHHTRTIVHCHQNPYITEF